ncbi:MAG: protein kinase, partial [Nannocystaceae bacterium]
LHDKFRFLRQLGKGGMAAVWSAVNTLVDRKVAIKLIRPEVARTEDTVARFRAEAKAAGRIGHPNVCEIIDFGVGPRGPYIVMERLRGKSLGELIRDEERLDPALAVGIVRQALAGLEAAHRRGIIHRDLKPENLFVHQAEAGPPVVKIMDFGVSKLTDGSSEVQTEHGALLGTPEYMAPEQFKGAAGANVRTDVWAMGAILYKALTGKTAFGGPTVAATLLMVTTDPHTPIPELVRGVPPELVAIVDRCLSKDPSLRFASAQELADELEAFDLGTLDNLVVTTSGAPDDEPAGPTVAVSSADVGALIPAATDAEDLETLLPTTRPRASAMQTRRPARPDRRAWALIIGVTVVGVGVLVALTRGPKDDEPVRTAASAAAEARSVSSGEVDPALVDGASEGGPPPTDLGAGSTSGAAGTTGSLPLATGMSSDTGETLSESSTSVAASGSSTGPAAADEPVDADEPVEAEAIDREPPARSNDDPEPTVAPRPSKPPPGTILVGNYLTLRRPGPSGTLAEAKAYCRNLGTQAFVGVTDWKLASPTVAKKVASEIRKGKYWTTALWQGKARVIAAPSTQTSSRDADRSGPRALCIARWP